MVTTSLWASEVPFAGPSGLRCFGVGTQIPYGWIPPPEKQNIFDIGDHCISNSAALLIKSLTVKSRSPLQQQPCFHEGLSSGRLHEAGAIAGRARAVRDQHGGSITANIHPCPRSTGPPRTSRDFAQCQALARCRV